MENLTFRALSKMPIKRLKAEDTYLNECCSICLENFSVNDLIRILPCKLILFIHYNIWNNLILIIFKKKGIIFIKKLIIVDIFEKMK